MRRRSVLALVTLAVAAINVPAVLLVAWVSIRDSGGGYLAIPFVLVPCLILGLGVGFLAALGAHVGSSIGSPGIDRFTPMSRAGRIGATVGSAFGGLVGGAPLLGYLVWLFQNSATIVGLIVIAYIVLAALLAGFTWYWCRQRV